MNASTIYIAEIASPGVRGRLGNLISVQLKIGILLAYALGSLLSLKMSSAIFAIITACVPILFLWLPESPFFYLWKGDKANAIKSIKQLRGADYAYVEDEILTISEKITKNNEAGSFGALKDPRNRKALWIMIGLFTFQSLSGTMVATVYISQIFQTINPNTSLVKLYNIIFGVVSLIGAMIPSFLVDKFGRKVLLILSSTTTSLSLFIIATYLYLKELGFDCDPYVAIPTVLLITYPLTVGLGIDSLPYVYEGELFAANFKAFGSCAVVVFKTIIGFLLLWYYPLIVDTYGSYSGLFGFALSTGISVFFIIFVVPETNCQTLEEIQDNMIKSKGPKEVELKTVTTVEKEV